MFISRSLILLTVVLVGFSQCVQKVDLNPSEALKQCLDSLQEIEEDCFSRADKSQLKRSSFGRIFYVSANVCISSINLISEEYLTGYPLKIVNEAKQAAIEFKSDLHIKIADSIEHEKIVELNKEKFQKRRIQIENQLKKIIESKSESKNIEEKIESLEAEKLKIEQERQEYENQLALEEAQRKQEEEARQEEIEEIELDRNNKEKWQKIWSEKLKEENRKTEELLKLETERTNRNHDKIELLKQELEVVVFEKMKAFKLYMGLPFDNRIKPPNFKSKKSTPAELEKFRREAITEMDGEASRATDPKKIEKKEIKEIQHLEEKISKSKSFEKHDHKASKISEELNELSNLKKQITAGAKLQENEGDHLQEPEQFLTTKSIFLSAEEFEIEKKHIYGFMFTINSLVKELRTHQAKLAKQPAPKAASKEPRLFSVIKKKLGKRN